MKSLAKGLWLVATLALGTEACTLVHARRNVETIERMAIVQGVVEAPAKAKPVVVFLFDEREGRKVVRSYAVRYGSGPFRFRADTEHPAYVFAIEDTNENRTWEDGEPAAWFGGSHPKRIDLGPGDRVEGLEITLATDVPEGTAELRALAAKGREGNPELMRIHEGDLASLDDPRFSAENGAKGLWRPVEFVREFGYGISFLEPYDPDRVPVLFVHGAGGSPRDFTTVIDELDRTRFQPWVASYPSGLRIGAIGEGMRSVLDEVAAKVHFERIVIVAHSIGGLVSRACINQIVERGEREYVAGFVTVSTPWQGHAAAETGTKVSPIVLPQWVDMAPTSPFLDSLLAERLPPAIPHHLFFGYDGGAGTDGTVSLASQLAPRAQEGASGIYGFAEDHTSILRSAAMLEKLNAVLRLLSAQS
jgi:pimeloyl-ACP methyl ester carboxylesterase